MPDEGQSAEFSQGCVFNMDSLPVVQGFDDGVPSIELVGCPYGVLLISQTCDTIHADQLQVARIVELPGRETAEAATGRRPRYVPVNLGGRTLFADLECIATVSREWLEGLGVESRAATSQDDARLIRDLIARRFGRFPFPDDVVAWCGPLRDKVAPRVKKTGAQGALLDKITCIRIEDENNWKNPQSYNLSLSFLVRPGTLPLVDGDGIGVSLPDAVEQRINAADDARRAQRIAECLVDVDKCELTAAEECVLWQRLVDSWVTLCNVKYAGLGKLSRVFGTGEVVSEDEYGFDRYRRSEQLDLDYLSRGAVGN